MAVTVPFPQDPMQSQAPMGCNVWSGGLRQKHMLGPHRWIGLGTWGPVMNPVGFYPLGVPIPLGILSPCVSCSLGVPIPLGILSPCWSCPLGSPISVGLLSPSASLPLSFPSPLGLLYPSGSHSLGAPVPTSQPVLFPPRSPSSITPEAAGTTPAEGPSSKGTGC